MNITIALGSTVFVLLMILVLVIKIAYEEHKEKLAYKSEAERKTNTINYLYKHFEELNKINAEKSEKIQEIQDAETDEEVLDIVSAVANRNNDKLRKQAKKGN